MAERVITFEDVVRSGACLSGVIEACKETGLFYGSVSECVKLFGEDEKRRIMFAAGLDGYGYGNGYGYGYGDGNGYGNGDGYGNGYGNGDG
jgi:hypoxanthine-guanine phosphoribosyltransferase